MSNSQNQGWRSGESTRLPPMWPRFDSWIRRDMWIEFVVGFRPCSEGFCYGSSGFSSLLKNQHFQIQIRSGIRGPQVYKLKDCLSVTLIKQSRFLSLFLFLKALL